jgi:hypothetical protein
MCSSPVIPILFDSSAIQAFSPESTSSSEFFNELAIPVASPEFDSMAANSPLVCHEFDLAKISEVVSPDIETDPADL